MKSNDDYNPTFMRLTKKEAYTAMTFFLIEIYHRTQSDTLGSLLGDMSLLQDGRPADSSVWDDWMKAIAKAREGKDDIKLRFE